MEYSVSGFGWAFVAAGFFFAVGIGGWLALAWLRGKKEEEDPLEKNPPTFI